MKERTLLLKYSPECRKNIFIVRGNATINEDIEEETESGIIVTRMVVRPLVPGTEVEVDILCRGVREAHKISWD